MQKKHPFCTEKHLLVFLASAVEWRFFAENPLPSPIRRRQQFGTTRPSGERFRSAVECECESGLLVDNCDSESGSVTVSRCQK